MGKLAAVGLIGMLALTAPAWPSSLYRCEGEDGVRSYVNRPLPGQSCRVVATGPASPPAASPAGEAPPTRFRSAPAGQSLEAPETPPGARVSRGAVYKYERDGVSHYTNLKPAAADAQVLFTYIETCYACAVRPGVDFRTVRLNTEAYREEVRTAARAQGLEEALLRAVIHAESAFDPQARSHKGAQGLMQLMPDTARRFGVDDPFQPAQNIRGGSEYLAWLLERYHGDVTLAAAAYNAGEGAVDRHGGVPPFGETQRYVERVNILAERYRGALATGGSR